MLFPRRFSYCHLLMHTVKGHCQSAHLPCTFSKGNEEYQGWEKDTERMLLLPSREKQGFGTGRKYQEEFEGGVKAHTGFILQVKSPTRKAISTCMGWSVTDWLLWKPVWDVQLCFPHQLKFRWVGQRSVLWHQPNLTGHVNHPSLWTRTDFQPSVEGRHWPELINWSEASCFTGWDQSRRGTDSE